MAKRVLTIGVGGSGKAAVTILKERLEETYGQVPDNVVLLSLDTDDLRDIDTFAGSRLSQAYDERGRESEYQHITSRQGTTMNTIFSDMASGRTISYMSWLEKDKLDRILSPAERSIEGGAQQRRPIGRIALFQRWANPIYQSITEAISRMYGEPEEEQQVDVVAHEKSKRVIFILGSVAGGTGSGFMMDIANLVRQAVQSNPAWQSVDVSTIVVLPDAFSAYTMAMDDPTNLKPNSFAALRELDRFIRAHSGTLPYMIRYGDNIGSITWSLNQPVDQAYLVDTASSGATGDVDLSRVSPMSGVFPLIADFMMAHIDQSLGDALATLRSNAGLHYNKEKGWQYSGFNVMTYIFPVDDVIESFSYRFLREMLARQYLPIQDAKTNTRIEQVVQKEMERLFSENSVGGKVNPAVIQSTIAGTKRVDPERPDVSSWTGLFNLIALSDTAFAQDYEDMDGWLGYLDGNLSPSKADEYKHEDYHDGYVRLLNFCDQFLDDCLGPQYDPDDEASRAGGQWDKILGRYPEGLRLRFAEAVGAAILEMFNKRHPQAKILEEARLPFARAMVSTLKGKLITFKELLEGEYRQLNIDERIRQTGQEVREAIAHMHETKDRGLSLGERMGWSTPKARVAQDSYISLFKERMDLMLHQRVYQVVVEVLDTLGAADEDKHGNRSVLDQIAIELENWETTFKEVNSLLAKWSRKHEQNREAKKRVKVRRYLTNAKFENQLYQMREHSGAVMMQVLGQVRGKVGITWEQLSDDNPLSYKMVTRWTEEAKGAEQIARRFFGGVKGLFQVVRENVTVADRVAAEFTSFSSFVGTVSQINEPFLRYNPAANEKQMFKERYVSFNMNRAQEEAQKFLENAQRTLSSQGFNVDTTAESLVACTVVEVSRGVRLSAVDQVMACQPEYRGKLYQGRETLHLFPEEQVATDYEGRIEILGEPDNRQRALSPELVVAMGDEKKLKAFTLACAYKLIEDGTYTDPESGERSTEIFIRLQGRRGEQLLRLSQSDVVQNQDSRFQTVGADEKLYRLYLNALQNFVLKATEKQGVPLQMIDNLVQDLQRRGVSVDHIDNPFTLKVRQVNQNINRVIEALGPSKNEEKDRKVREAKNARHCVETYLQPFLNDAIQEGFKKSPAQRIKDMGTVMHLILQKEINGLKEKYAGA